jgi:hypothetical protein
MFDQFYQQSSDQLKLSFLKEALRKYPHLKEDYISFYLKPSDAQLQLTLSDPEDFILASADLIQEDLESINLNEPDWKNYVPRHSGYIPEYEAMAHMAEDEIGRIIGFHVSEVERYCTIKHFDLAFLYLISLYQACSLAELKDDYETLPDPTYTMFIELEDQLQSILPLFKSIQPSDNHVYTIGTVLIDQFQKYHMEDKDFLVFFESFLFAIIHSGGAATILVDIVEAKKVGDQIPWLLSELHRKIGGHQAWEKTALHYFKKNKFIADSLLHSYKNDNKPEFAKIASELWNNGIFQEEFAELYFENLLPEYNLKFYLEVSVHLNNRQFSENYYRVIQELMTTENRLKYIENFKRNKPAYVLALFLEEKHAEALSFASQHTDRWNIVEMMAPCIRFQPRSALEVLENKIEELLVDERGRNFYERVARVLKMASDSAPIQEDAKKMANRFYSFYSRLSAFRGELIKAGLISK